MRALDRKSRSKKELRRQRRRYRQTNITQIQEIDNGVNADLLPPMRDSEKEEYHFIANENILIGRGSVGQIETDKSPRMGDNRLSLAMERAKEFSPGIRKNLKFHNDIISPVKPETVKRLISSAQRRKMGKLRDLEEVNKITVKAELYPQLKFHENTTKLTQGSSKTEFNEKIPKTTENIPLSIGENVPLSLPHIKEQPEDSLQQSNNPSEEQLEQDFGFDSFEQITESNDSMKKSGEEGPLLTSGLLKSKEPLLENIEELSENMFESMSEELQSSEIVDDKNKPQDYAMKSPGIKENDVDVLMKDSLNNQNIGDIEESVIIQTIYQSERVTGVPKKEEPKDFTKKVYFPESKPLPALESKIFEEDEEYEEGTPVASRRELPSNMRIPLQKTELEQIDSENEELGENSPSNINRQLNLKPHSSLDNFEKEENQQTRPLVEMETKQIQKVGLVNPEIVITERNISIDRNGQSSKNSSLKRTHKEQAEGNQEREAKESQISSSPSERSLSPHQNPEKRDIQKTMSISTSNIPDLSDPDKQHGDENVGVAHSPLQKVPSYISRDSLNLSQNISIMSLKKEIARGEIKNFVKKSIMANFGHSKANNVDMQFDDVLQGYDKGVRNEDDTLRESMTSNGNNYSSKPNLVRGGSEISEQNNKIFHSGDVSNFSDKILHNSSRGGGRFTSDYTSLGHLSPSSRKRLSTKRREMEILIQANHVSDSSRSRDQSRLSRINSRMSNGESVVSGSKSTKQQLNTKNILQGLDENENTSGEQHLTTEGNQTGQDGECSEHTPANESLVATVISLDVRSSQAQIKDEEDLDQSDIFNKVPLTPHIIMERYRKQKADQWKETGNYSGSRNKIPEISNRVGLSGASEMVKKFFIIILVLSVMEIGKFFYLRNSSNIENDTIIA